ncbi:ArsR/SmtB family transcription factor [Mucilaginibacter celer]|uniref:ArsR family transcriptional regulator n=1 Tax=Mucilaginibacter celer TaxID=2305508 RepID=A0A494VZT8_9SPHI|nr:metalloregulator ArsR/SmtB family transcription factor [Mucilaginibacter celer]AYL96482.1 ArsR family transcriptional regulator [Mucilaginibacter celer]
MSALKLSDLSFNALGDPTRRKIFEKLQNGPLTVVHIAADMTVSRPAVSQHLKVLKEARLIQITRQGTRSVCEIDREGILAMRNYLDQFWDEALANFKKLAEADEQSKN